MPQAGIAVQQYSNDPLVRIAVCYVRDTPNTSPHIKTERNIYMVTGCDF